MLVTVLDRQLIIDRASRLDYGRDTCLVCDLKLQSGNGKKASEAITAPFKSKPNDLAFSMACLKESTREVCPIPLAQSCLFFTKVIALDLLFFTILLANNRSSTSELSAAYPS